MGSKGFEIKCLNCNEIMVIHHKQELSEGKIDVSGERIDELYIHCKSCENRY